MIVKNKILLIILVHLLFCFPVLTSFADRDEDPCFFRVTTQNERKIYVLGSVHSIKIEDVFSVPALEELRKVANEENPILFTEHILSNQAAFQIIDTCRDEVRAKRNWSSSVISEEYESLTDQPLYTAVGRFSQYRIRDIFEFEPWLAAPILSTHAGIIFYPNFGGTEYNLESDEFWRSCWSSICYLEGPEHYDLLKEAAPREGQHNLDWIRSTFNKLLLMKSILQNPEDITRACHQLS